MAKKKIYNGGVGLMQIPASRTVTNPGNAMDRSKFFLEPAAKFVLEPAPKVALVPEVVLNVPPLFSPACLAEAEFVKTTMANDIELLIKVKEALNIMLDKLKNIAKTTEPLLSEEDAIKLFLSDQIMGYMGNIGTNNPTQKWDYLTRSPSIDPISPSCRVKLTALVNFTFSNQCMTKYIMFTPRPNRFVLARRELIKQIFKQNEITPKMINDNFHIRIAWSPTDYIFPSLALRRSIVADIRVKKLKNLTQKIYNNTSTKNNIKKIANINYQGAKVCKYNLSILNEPLSEEEKVLIREQRHLPVGTDITAENYPFKLGACYDQQTITKNPKNKLNIAKGVCRVVGISGTSANILDTALILGLNWKPIYLSLIIDFVPIHHSITEIFDSLLELGCITKEEYNNTEDTIKKHIREVKELEDYDYDYTPKLNHITRGYKLTQGGYKRKTRKTRTLKYRY